MKQPDFLHFNTTSWEFKADLKIVATRGHSDHGNLKLAVSIKNWWGKLIFCMLLQIQERQKLLR